MTTNLHLDRHTAAPCAVGADGYSCVSSQSRSSNTIPSFAEHLRNSVGPAGTVATGSAATGSAATSRPQPPVSGVLAFPQAVQQDLERFSASFRQVSRLEDKLLSRAKGDLKPLIETQVLSSRLNLQTQLLTRAADTCAYTLKRLQQLGSGS